MSEAAPSIVPVLRGRPPRAHVVMDPPPDEIGARVDWSAWYLTDEEDMGESGEQHEIIAILESVLRELARERGWQDVLVSGDQFFAWVRKEPLVRVSPDVYLLDDAPPPPHPPSWKTWREGHRPPRFAVEVVSGDERHPARWRKDYEESPAKYAQLGTAELAVFDPEAAAGRAGGERVALQVFRRDDDGAFVRVYGGPGPARSEELDAWLAVVRRGSVARLRVARDAAGLKLVPTAEEARQAEARARQAAEEAQQAEAKARQAAEEAQQAEAEARQAAEREAAALRAELERLRQGGST